MGPSVLTFWQMPDDEKAMFEYFKNTGDIVVFPFGKQATKMALNPQALLDWTPSSGCSYLLALADSKEQVTINTFEDEGSESFFVSPILSPVIGYEAGHLSNQRLTATNMFAYWETRDVTGTWIHKPHEFVHWGKNVFRWLRRHVNQRLDGVSLPMTASVVKAIEDGVELAQG